MTKCREWIVLSVGERSKQGDGMRWSRILEGGKNLQFGKMNDEEKREMSAAGRKLTTVFLEKLEVHRMLLVRVECTVVGGTGRKMSLDR